MTKVPIGHSSPAFSHDDPAATLKACASAGFDAWEIMGDGRHYIPDAAPKIMEALRSYPIKLQLHAPIADVNIGSLNPPMWELSQRLIEDSFKPASKLGIRRVTIHPGVHSPLSRGHYDKVHAQTKKALARLSPKARDYGIDLCLENMATSWAFETDSVERLVDLVEGLEMGFTLDLGHAHIAKRLDEFFALKDRIHNVHIHDNKGATDDHLGLGEGTVPWKNAVERLVGLGYRNTFVIESRNHASGARSQTMLRTELTRIG